MTKFTVEMAELRRHINYVRHGLGNSRTDLPVMMFRFEINGNRAVIFAANKESFTRTEMKISPGEEAGNDGAFGVMGDKIESLIAQLEAEQVVFQSDNTENLQAVAGFLTVNFELFDSSPLRTIAEGVKEHLTLEGLSIPRTALEEALVCGKICTQSSSTKLDLNHVELRKGLFLSSDGRKIMIYQHQGIPEEVSLKVPSSALNDIAAAVKNMADTEAVQVIEGKSYYYLKGQGNKFTCGVRKVERSFPDVEKRIDTTADAKDEVNIDRKVFENMLKGVALGLPVDDVRVQVDLLGKGREAVLEVSALNSSGKRSHERASIGRKAEDTVSFPISFKHLLETLGVYKGDSVVDMFINPAKNLLTVRDKTEARQVTTVIPFRTDKAIEEEKKEREELEKAKKPAPVPTTEPKTDVVNPAEVEQILED